MYWCTYRNFKVHKKYLVSPVPTHQEYHFNRLGWTQKPNVTITLDQSNADNLWTTLC